MEQFQQIQMSPRSKEEEDGVGVRVWEKQGEDIMGNLPKFCQKHQPTKPRFSLNPKRKTYKEHRKLSQSNC